MFNRVSTPSNTLGRRTLRGLILALLLTLVSTGTAFAGPWQLGFAVGSGDLGSSEGPDLDLRGEFRVAKYLTDRFALEAQAMSASAIFDASLAAWMLNGVYDLRPGEKVVPYVMAGAGHARFTDVQFLGNQPSVSEGGLAYQVGLGTHVYFGSARRLAWRLELSSLWEDTELFDRDRHTSLVTGLTWTIGR